MTYYSSPCLITYYYLILLTKFPSSQDFNYLYITMFQLKKNILKRQYARAGTSPFRLAVKSTVTARLPSLWAPKAQPEPATLPTHAVGWLHWKPLLFQFKASVKGCQAVIYQERRVRGEEHTRSLSWCWLQDIVCSFQM